MPTLQLPSALVHYRESGQGVPILLLHANPGDSRDFDAIAPSLARIGHVLALDWPGYGLSPLPADPAAVTLESYRGVLLELVQALGLRGAVIIGNSLGGNCAAWIATQAPEFVRALVLASPGGFTQSNWLTRAFSRLQGSRWSLPPRRWAGRYLRRHTETTAAMMERAAGYQTEPARIALGRALWRSFAQPAHDLRGVASAIRVPTMLIFGRDDPAVPAHKDGRVAARCMPAAQFVELQCGHASFAELPEEMLRAAIPFIEGVLRNTH